MPDAEGEAAEESGVTAAEPADAVEAALVSVVDIARFSSS